ncbi:MAG: cell division topological specificity factor MinE [Thiothrix sp.]|nr:MAG: cell division topological specificity factor MinE [Thiothrix sp.]
MRLIDFFRKNQKPSSASVARERLQILVAHERIERHTNSYLPQLKEDLLKVIRKYVEVDQESINVQLEMDGSQEILELNIVLPEKDEVRKRSASS